MANDLHALLTHAGISGPIVLVGYGLSGLSDRLYADRYGADVRGMVLVDPTVPYMHPRLEQTGTRVQTAVFAIRGVRPHLSARRGAKQLTPGAPAFAQCMYTPPGPALPAAVQKLVRQWWQRPSWWQALSLADLAADTASSDEVVREQRSYGDMPLIVLTSDERVNVGQMPITAAQKAALEKAWPQWHQQIAALSSRGSESVVSGSSSNMAVDAPASIVRAIRQVTAALLSGQ